MAEGLLNILQYRNHRSFQGSPTRNDPVDGFVYIFQVFFQIRQINGSNSNIISLQCNVNKLC